MSNPKKLREKRNCDSCEKVHWYVVNEPCEECKGLLCFKCCMIKQCPVEAMEAARGLAKQAAAKLDLDCAIARLAKDGE